jgi:hypothetical protein
MIPQLTIYDILGREIANLIPPLRGGEAGFQPGSYELTWDASNYNSGIYFCRLIISDFETQKSLYSETRKMILLK